MCCNGSTRRARWIPAAVVALWAAVVVACAARSNNRPSSTIEDAGADSSAASPGEALVDDAGYPGEPSVVTSGGNCASNSDCTNSAAAQALAGARCTGWETYCLNGTCFADCAGSCLAIRSDINPCPPQRFCAPELGSCKIVPISCGEASDCPAYLPPLPDGGVAAWTCDAGICAYPGIDYATH